MGHYVIGDDIPGLNRQMISDYIRYRQPPLDEPWLSRIVSRL